MKSKLVPDSAQPSKGRQRSRSRLRYSAGLLALIASIGALASCGGGGGSDPPAAVPLAWDGAQATWDNVTWQ